MSIIVRIEAIGDAAELHQLAKVSTSSRDKLARDAKEATTTPLASLYNLKEPIGRS